MHPVRRTVRPAVLALSLLALAACGDGGTTSPLTDGTPAEQTVEPTAAAGGTDTVDIDDFRFAPDTVTVPVGTEVTWTNRDATAHTVTAGSEDEPRTEDFDLDVAAQGDTVSTTFDGPGTYDYFCELHPFMEGTVEVTA